MYTHKDIFLIRSVFIMCKCAWPIISDRFNTTILKMQNIQVDAFMYFQFTGHTLCFYQLLTILTTRHS